MTKSSELTELVQTKQPKEWAELGKQIPERKVGVLDEHIGVLLRPSFLARTWSRW